MSGPSRKPSAVARRAPMDRSSTFLGHEGEYNIWYHKTLGQRNFEKRDKLAWLNVVPMMCTTKGERLAGKTKPYVCLFFARGKCDQGEDCHYLHREPRPSDHIRIDATVDVFGRERHATERDDHGGTGSFLNDNRTLYVGRLSMQLKDIHDRLHKYFSAWGEIASLRVIDNRAICFVEYVHRTNAEFAKIVTGDQAIFHPDSNSAVNVRWAIETDRQIEARKKREREQFAEKHQEVHGKVPEVHYTANPAGNPAKRSRVGGEPDIAHYPNTDAQYTQQAPSLEPPTSDVNSEEYKQWYMEYMAYYYPEYLDQGGPPTQDATSNPTTTTTTTTTTTAAAAAAAASTVGDTAQDWAAEQARLHAWKVYYAQMGIAYDPTAVPPSDSTRLAGTEASNTVEPAPPGAPVTTAGEDKTAGGALALLGNYNDPGGDDSTSK